MTDHNDPTNWKWGIFYCNKEDKRLFLPKKNPASGITVNFANPYSVLIVLVIIGVIVGIVVR
jgi:uncharacterized membrane protein